MTIAAKPPPLLTGNKFNENQDAREGGLDRLHAVIVMKAEDEWVWYMYNCCYNEGDGIQSQEKMRRWKQDDRAHCIHRPLLTKYTSYELDIINLSIAAERKEYHSISTSHTQRRCTSFHSKREANRGREMNSHDRETLQQLINLFIRHLFSQLRQHVSQLTDTDPSTTFFIEYLETLDELVYSGKVQRAREERR